MRHAPWNSRRARNGSGEVVHGNAGVPGMRTDAAADSVTPLAHDAAHWFRRALHAFGAVLIVYYLIPDHGAWGAFKRFAPPVLLLAAVVVEAARIRGWIPSEHMFGLREYERRRVGSYLYFGLATLLLLTFAPQSLAVPCLVGVALLDPLHGELRAAGRPRLGVTLGGVAGAGLFLLAGWAWPWALVGGALLAAGEVWTIRGVDDDLLMGLLPALGLGLAAAAGLADVPAPFIHPLTGVP